MASKATGEALIPLTEQPAAPSPGASPVSRELNTYKDVPRVNLGAVLAAYTTYKVKAGDSLSTIAQHLWGHGSDWPSLWWVNRTHIKNPTALTVGQVLQVPSSGTVHGAMLKDALAAIPKPPPLPAVSSSSSQSSGGGTTQPPSPPPPSGGGIYSYSQLEALWVSAGGPASVEAAAATIAECESGGNPMAYNPSGASGLFQILGQVVPGYIFNPMVNALNAVAKYRAAGDSFSPWVCQP